MKKTVRSTIKDCLLSFLLLMAVGVFQVIVLYANNADSVPLAEALMPMLYNVAGMVLCSLILLPFLHSPLKCAAISVLVFFLTTAFFQQIMDVTRMVIPSVRRWHLLPILLYIALIIAVVLHHKVSAESMRTVVGVLALVFSALVVINVITAIPKYLVYQKSEQQKQHALFVEAEESTQVDGRMPNIYYYIFDEACGFRTIQKHYGYDPTNIAQAMQDRGFTVSYDGHNDSINTSVITTNLVYLDYHVSKLDNEATIRATRPQGTLFSLLREKGYSLYSLGISEEHYGLPALSSTASASALTAGGETFEYVVYQNSCFEPFLQATNIENAQVVLDALNYFTIPQNIPQGNTFVLAHLEFPHAPFYFDKNGNPIKGRSVVNYADKSYYLGQYELMCTYMQRIADNIIAHDPDSIIVFSSDHGSRMGYSYALGFLSTVSFDDISNILNCVYYRGEDISEVKDQSSVNTMRLILNRLLGTEYELLEVPDNEFEIYWKALMEKGIVQ